MKSNDKLRKLGIVFINFILFYTLLRLIILLAERTGIVLIYYIGSAVYMIGAAAVFLTYFCLNGYTLNRREWTIDELPEKWSDEQKQRFMERQPKRKKKAQQLIYILMPVVVTLFINYIELAFLK